jgi:hypothetical protein
MPTLYCDLENGNDNHGGTSFAPLAQGTNGRISGTTFSSTGANFPNDGSLIGQYLSIFGGTSYLTYVITGWVSSTSLTIAQISGGNTLASQSTDRQYFIGGRWRSITNGATAVRLVPGDIVRIMGSPAPTSLGQSATWISNIAQPSKGISGSTNTAPISLTVTGHGYTTGDTVVVSGHASNTNANGTWEITVTGANTFTLDGSVGNSGSGSGGTVRLRTNSRVMLTSAVTQNIASTGPGRSAWVASSNCIHSFNSSLVKEHASADTITINTAFTTGKAAYYTLPSTLDLSSYQQVSFWLYTSGDDLLASEAELRLCSDTTGDVVVDTVPIAATPAGRFRAVTWDKGAALGSSISSISLFINIDLSTTGNVALILNNIIACKASSSPDSLTLTSLIGKNTTNETFWGIQSINGRRVMLDADTSSAPNNGNLRGYYGTTETVTTWKRETIKVGPISSANALVLSIQEGGVQGSPITFSGGWDRTAMSAQNLESWIDGVNGNGLLYYTNYSYCNISNCAFVRGNNGYYISSQAAQFNEANLIAGNNCTSSGVYSTGGFNNLSCNHVCSNGGTGADVSSLSGLNKYVFPNICSNMANGMRTALLNFDTATFNSYNNLLAGVRVDHGGAGRLINCRIGSNGNSGIARVNSANICLINCLIEDSNEVDNSTFIDTTVFSHDHDQTPGNHKIFGSSSLISSATDQRRTASGISWKMQPTNTIRDSTWPVVLSLAKVAVAANSLVTVKAWMRRNNSGLTMRLVCKGGQISGVSNDVVASVTTTDAWEEEVITFMPTTAGVVEITAEAWGGNTFSGWVDDMTISQA